MLFIPKGRRAVREVLRSLGAGRCEVMVADQHAGSRGTPAPFLGRRTPTPALPGAFVARRRTPLCLYCARKRLLIQGGSLFLRKRARPVFEYVYDRLTNDRCRKDEYALTEATARPEFLHYFEVLDYSFNLGDTDFALRYQLTKEPIRVVHFHLEREAHRATLLAGRNPLELRLLDDRFLALVEKHGFGVAPAVLRPTPGPGPWTQAWRWMATGFGQAA